MQTVAVLLAGGGGTRLYPASRPDRPKQFLAFGDGPSLVERTADRTGFADRTYVVTTERYADQVRETVPEAAILVEPQARDTGPALVYAAHRIREAVGDCVLACLPTDHYVEGAVTETLSAATRVAAESDALVTIGVDPDRPATGYGYIEPGPSIADGAARRVVAFHEKPGADTASTYVDDGWLWNAGMFAWTPSALLAAARDSPLSGLVDALAADHPIAGFEAAPAMSIDHAVLESAEDVAVVPAGFAWDDVGSWDAVARVFGTELAPHSTRIDSPDTVTAADDDHHIAVLGVEDLVVAAYDGRVLVCPREDAERVKELVATRTE
ncbi:MAG: mannose-1-phosphate guanylyltransferase [Halobacteriaceae archaeon]